ncbi:hypothetical protein LCGC14_2804820, partial [marine sediment metagenome]
GLTDGRKADWQRAYRAGIELEAAGDHEAALGRYAEAEKIDGRFAELHFRAARCCLVLKRFEQARRHFRLARDLDALRFRADSQVNSIIRQVGSARQTRGVFLVDAERAFEQSAETPHGNPGGELFHEHVHMNFRGNYELARAVLARVAEILPESIRSGDATGPGPPSPGRCAEGLALTGLGRYRMAEQIWRTTGRPPFTNQLDHAKWRRRQFRKLRELSKHALRPGVDEALAAAQRALQEAPDDLILRRRVAQLLYQTGQAAESVKQWRQILQHLPDSPDAKIDLGAALLATGNADAAMCWNAVAHLRLDGVDVVPIGPEHLPTPGVDTVSSATGKSYSLTPVYVNISTLTCSDQPAAAKAFAEYVASAEASAAFTEFGFTMSGSRKTYEDGKPLGRVTVHVLSSPYRT